MRGRLLLLIGGLALVASASVSAAGLDVIRGTRGPETINGTAGGDLIYARAGNDAVRGQDGGDVIYGGDGNDVVRGGPGNDVIYGGEGNDVTWAGGGADVQFGGEGDDGLHALAHDNTRDVMDCGPGVGGAHGIEHHPGPPPGWGPGIPPSAG